MKNVYIVNAFSAQMLDLSTEHSVRFQPATQEEFDAVKATATSVVGHPDTARVLGVAYNRVNLRLQAGDVVYIAQLVGGRLPEGTTVLPAGFHFVFVKVTIH